MLVLQVMFCLLARADSNTAAKTLQSANYRKVSLEFSRNVVFDEPAPNYFCFTVDADGSFGCTLGRVFPLAYVRQLIAEQTKNTNIAVVIFREQHKTPIETLKKVADVFEENARGRIQLILVDHNGQGFLVFDPTKIFPPPRTSLTVPPNLLPKTDG